METEIARQVAAEVARLRATEPQLGAAGTRPLQMVLATTFDMVHVINQSLMQLLATQVEATNRPAARDFQDHISVDGDRRETRVPVSPPPSISSSTSDAS